MTSPLTPSGVGVDLVHRALLSCGMLFLQYPPPAHLGAELLQPSKQGAESPPVILSSRPWERLALLSSCSRPLPDCAAGFVIAVDFVEDAVEMARAFKVPRGMEGRMTIVLVTSLGGVVLPHILKKSRSTMLREQVYLMSTGSKQ